MNRMMKTSEYGHGKFLQILMPDGTLWELPATIVASHMAKYYQIHPTRNSRDTYDRIYNRAMADEGALIHWATHYLPWSIIANYASLVGTKNIHNYSSQWREAHKLVLTR